MKPTDRSVSEALSGLKPQVQSAPFSLEMVSTLLVAVLPPPEPELELELEPALQPAASRPAAMMTPYRVRRLMPWSLLPFGRDLVRKGGCAVPMPACRAVAVRGDGAAPARRAAAANRRRI